MHVRLQDNSTERVQERYGSNVVELWHVLYLLLVKKRVSTAVCNAEGSTPNP